MKEIKIVKATADVNPPDQALEAIFDDKSNKKRITGPIQYAIDGKDETAWGIDIGPGRSNVPRQAVFVLEKPVEFAKGTRLIFRLKQSHGGWNSDDNQNNNLGRFRFSVTDVSSAVADPVPARVRQVIQKGDRSRTKSDEDAVFSYWRTTVKEWQTANDAIEKLWKEHPEGASQFVLQNREMPRDTHILKRGDFLKPGDAVGRRRPGGPESTSEGRRRATGWPSHAGSCRDSRRQPRGRWLTACGKRISAPGSSPPAKTWERRASHPYTPSYWTGSRSSSWNHRPPARRLRLRGA